MERADAEGAERQPLDVFRLESSLELRRLRCFHEASGQEQKYTMGVHPSQRKRQRTRRRGVEPLDVVDREYDGLRPGERVEGRPDRDAERPPVDGPLGAFSHEQRDFERLPSRRRHRGQHLVEHALEEIAERDVRQPALGLCGPRGQHPQPLLARGLDPGQPNRRLADSCVAFEHERVRPLDPLEEGVQRGQLLVSADDVQGRHEGSVRASSVRERIPSLA